MLRFWEVGCAENVITPISLIHILDAFSFSSFFLWTSLCQYICLCLYVHMHKCVCVVFTNIFFFSSLILRSFRCLLILGSPASKIDSFWILFLYLPILYTCRIFLRLFRTFYLACQRIRKLFFSCLSLRFLVWWPTSSFTNWK